MASPVNKTMSSPKYMYLRIHVGQDVIYILAYSRLFDFFSTCDALVEI